MQWKDLKRVLIKIDWDLIQSTGLFFWRHDEDSRKVLRHNNDRNIIPAYHRKHTYDFHEYVF